MKIRTTMQPTVEIEVDEHDKKVLEHQGLLWSGTDEELAEHYEAAGLKPPPAPSITASPTTTSTAATAAAAAKEK